MSPIRILVLVIAAVAAIGAALLVRGMVAGKQVPAAAAAPSTLAAAPEHPTVQVMVAKRDLPVGTRLVADDLGWTTWPADALNPAFITNGAAAVATASTTTGKIAKSAQSTADNILNGAGPIQAMQGSIVREAILAREPITQRKLVRAGQGGYMSVVLAPGRRAVAIPISAENASGGFILPGDRVDVLQSRASNNPFAAIANMGAPKNEFVTDTVLTNIKVLAIDQATEPAKDSKALIGSTATLEVKPSEAEALMRAKAKGTLILALRALPDTNGPTGPGAPGEDDASAHIVRIHRGGEVTPQGVAR